MSQEKEKTHCYKCWKITDVSDSRWCKDCYYPGIDDDWNEYQALLDEGYRRCDAAIRSGWMTPDEL